MNSNQKISIYICVYILTSIYSFVVSTQFNVIELRGLFVISILHILLVFSWYKNFSDSNNAFYFFLFFYFLFVYLISSLALLLVIMQANIFLVIMNIFLFVLSSMKAISISWGFKSLFGL